MQVCVHTVTLPCLCFCTYILPLIKIYFYAKFCLMSFVKPSHAFKLNSVLDSRGTVWLDKVVYFTLEQTPKKWAVCYALLGKKLPQQNMLIKIRFYCWNLSVTAGEKGQQNSRWKLKNHFEPDIFIYIIVARTLRPTKVHRARRINKDTQSKPHSKHERRELKKNARMDNFWRKKDKKFNKNVSVRDLLQLFTTFE